MKFLTWHAPLLCEPSRRWEFWWRDIDHREWGFHIRFRQRIFCLIWGRFAGNPKD